jgi:hydroxymethylpyrimidine/phosphomethylpyrimidine kinase
MRLAYVTVTAIKIGELVQAQTIKYLKNSLDKLAIDFGVHWVLYMRSFVLMLWQT